MVSDRYMQGPIGVREHVAHGGGSTLHTVAWSTLHAVARAYIKRQRPVAVRVVGIVQILKGCLRPGGSRTQRTYESRIDIKHNATRWRVV